MTGSEKLVAMLVGGIVMLSAINASGWQSSNVTEDPRQETSGVPASTIRRTPAEMPPNPPKVTCEGGKLTISAANSTLGAVLSAIRTCTGAEVEVPEGARGERLFAELGPGPIRTVLADFLSSTDFNYVIKASPTDPLKVQMVLLNLRTGDSTIAAAPEVANDGDGNMSTNRRAWQEARHNYELSVSPPNEEPIQPADTAPSASPPAETPTTPANTTPAGVEPGSVSPPAVSAPPTPESEISPTSPGSGSTPSQGKSTQEMISDMQRLFEQRKQMTTQQPPTAH